MAFVHPGSGISRVVYRASLATNLLLSLGGLFLAAVVSIQFASYVATYRGPVDGDVTRGPSIVIATGLIAAVFAGIAFLLLRIGQRWANWFDVLLWSVAWLPASINLSGLTRDPGIGYGLTSTVCLLGIILSVATFFLMPPSPGNKQPADNGPSGQRDR